MPLPPPVTNAAFPDSGNPELVMGRILSDDAALR
jgi:hypothetical protein